MEHETLIQLAEQLGVTGSALMESYANYVRLESICIIAALIAVVLGIALTYAIAYYTQRGQKEDDRIFHSSMVTLVAAFFILALSFGVAHNTAKILEPEGATVSRILYQLGNK